ncbi:hypothetical protein HDU76_014008 [Blyttiomyces sp. JEL0837]|nr:hypothetical protein HDU76_014008 [Blyttiomyces sp. JEL0837]
MFRTTLFVRSAKAVIPKTPSSTAPLSTSTTSAASSSKSQPSPSKKPQSSQASPSKISVGLLVKRNPVVLRDFSQFESFYYKYREDIDREVARNFQHDFYFKKGSLAEQRWLKAQSDAGSEPSRPHPTRAHDEDLLSAIKALASRKSKADVEGDVKSLDRDLQRSLYLLVQSKKLDSWILPAGEIEDKELLHEAADRVLQGTLSHTLETWTVGKAPVGLYKDANEKVFFMKQLIISGEIRRLGGEVKDYAWLTKEEIEKRVSPNLDISATNPFISIPDQAISASSNNKKMGKEPTKKKAQRHDPLHMEMLKDRNPLIAKELAAKEGLTGSRKGRKPKSTLGGPKQSASESTDMVDDDDVDVAGPSFVDATTSKKILKIARDQQAEEEEMMDNGDDMMKETETVKFQTAFISASKPKFDSDDEKDDEEPEEDVEEWNDETTFEYLGIDAKDAELIEKFMNPSHNDNRTLADHIMDKINAFEKSGVDPSSGEMPSSAAAKKAFMNDRGPQLDPKIVEVYTKVGLLLSRYRSGKLPKVFKIIPSLPNWEEVLFLTNPSSWTPHATYQATRIFVSNLSAKMAQQFFNLFLLDRVRDDIAETKKLNYHHYMSLKKALYKPSAFFKGLLLPLCESGTCTLREAAIIGSVITKVSIPIEHSAAALWKIAEMNYSGANSFFIRVLLDKKYALPYQVIDALVAHFLRFKNDHRDLPVLWHQSLLVFAQRYKGELVPEQKEALLDLIRVKTHPSISAEIRREIVNSKCRGELLDIDMMQAN